MVPITFRFCIQMYMERTNIQREWLVHLEIAYFIYNCIIIIVSKSPQLKSDLSGLSVNVGEGMITQSSKVRKLGVIFDQILNFAILC